MLFILLFALLIGSELLFVKDLLQSPYFSLQLIGQIQPYIIVALVILVLFNRRGNMTEKYRMVMNLFGTFVVFFVPTLGYLIPGILYHITHIQGFFTAGLIMSGILLIAILHGILRGRWTWKTHHVTLPIQNLPEHLENTKIVQISDIHVGSFLNNHSKVQKAIDKINQLNADFVFFTGDLVNNAYHEMEGWVPVFSKIKALKGKFSIVGNHDYGDYVKWPSNHLKQQHFNTLIDIHKQMGFTPLLNESVKLESDFWLLGIENWGKPPFRQSGDLAKALENVPQNAFKVLLSHDPSHFDAQVVGQPIHLTLSGHTHGMQFGIERWGIKWSPVSFKYPKWAGLYSENNQFLYVNRGFGFIGFPGRVGIYPEITSITLQKAL